MSPLILNTIATICFVAGKSGGHLLPCITKAQQIKKEHPQTEIYLFSTGTELENKILNKQSYINNYAPTNLWDVPYQSPWLFPLFIGNATWYFFKSLYKLWNIQASKVVSFGGFNSIPVCLAAKILHIPFELYELNVEPGKATKFLSRFTSTIYTCFEQTKQYFPNNTCIRFDYPVRFTQQDKQHNKEQLLAEYNFSPTKKNILILGGSQGSTLLNEVFKEWLLQNPTTQQSIQIVHQTGGSESETYQKVYKELGIPAIVFGYHEQLQNFYNLADIIISRAGAGTLFEIKFFDKKCICIPHQTANTNHQIKNVLALQEENPHQFSIIQQSDFTPSTLLSQLQKFEII